MPQYVTLFKWTEAGRRAIKESPSRVKTALANLSSGTKILSVGFTMGQYDMIITYEAANDETAVRAVARQNASGNVESCTMRAFTPDEFEKLVADL
jgi:uncharacterized protein with GYD domain